MLVSSHSQTLIYTWFLSSTTAASDASLTSTTQVLKARPDLKLVVMSATLEAEKFQGYFLDAPLMKVPGRLHPVEIFYTQARDPRSSVVRMFAPQPRR